MKKAVIVVASIVAVLAVLLVVGDRADVHLRAIEMGVRIIIVTGGHRMRPEVRGTP
mgnify:CR=1 FL=1